MANWASKKTNWTELVIVAHAEVPSLSRRFRSVVNNAAQIGLHDS